jgi:rubrerythrin
MEENEDAVLVAHDNQDRAIDENNDAEFHDDDEEDEDSQSSELGADNSQPSDEAKSLSPEMYSALTGLASRLCAICQNLCRGEAKLVAYFSSGYFQKTGKLEYHSSLSSLRESVDAGCPLCKEVSRSFEECLDMEPGVRDTITDSWYSTCDQQPTAWCRSIDEQTGLRFNFRFYNSSGQGADHKLVNNIYMYFFPAEELGLGPEYSGQQ